MRKETKFPASVYTEISGYGIVSSTYAARGKRDAVMDVMRIARISSTVYALSLASSVLAWALKHRRARR
jgi:hypothetical protein